MSNEYFKDKTAIVTGAASGFGLGFSQRLLSLGARKVWMADFDAQKLGEQADKLKALYPGRVEAVRANAMARADVEGLVERAARESGGLDFIFNNAGRPMTKPSEDLSVEEFEDLIRLNYMGVMYGTLAALKVMLPRNRGHIVNTASCGGLMPAPYQTAYASTKAAVIAMTRCLAYEYAHTGIHFSQISPMNVATNIFTAQLREELRRAGESKENIEKTAAKIIAPDAMPLDEALDYIFAEITKQVADIILGQDGRAAYRQFCEDRLAFDKWAAALAASRRAFYEAAKRGEDVQFPG